LVNFRSSEDVTYKMLDPPLADCTQRDRPDSRYWTS